MSKMSRRDLIISIDLSLCRYRCTALFSDQRSNYKHNKNGEVAQWLALRICSAYRDVDSSNLTVSTDDPLG